MKRVLIYLFFLLLLPCSVWAANYYVGDHDTHAGYNSGGGADGSDWNNTYDELSDAESVVSRGDTIYVGDGTYASVTFNVAASGSTYIYIKKAVSDAHGTETGWASAYGDGTATFDQAGENINIFTITTDYWDIDGVSGGGPGSWDTGHGFVVDTDYGQAGIRGDYASYVALKHIEVAGNGGNDDAASKSNDLFYWTGTSSVKESNLTISHCYAHDSGRVHFVPRWTDNVLVEYNLFDTNESTPTEHSESIATHAGDDFDIRYNIFANVVGTGQIVLKKNNIDGTWTNDNFKIHGNVFFHEALLGDTEATIGSNGFICDTSVQNGVAASTNIKIYNNAFVNIPHNGIAAFVHDGSDADFQNNIVYHNNAAMSLWTNTTHSNNWYYYNYRRDREPPPLQDTALVSGETGAVQGACDPFATNSGTPPSTPDSYWVFTDFDDFILNASASGNLPIDAGVDLGSTYETDPNDNTRGADGNWDIGAYEYADTASNTPDDNSGSGSGNGGGSGCYIDTVQPLRFCCK